MNFPDSTQSEQKRKLRLVICLPSLQEYGVNPLAWAGNAKLQINPDMTIEYVEEHSNIRSFLRRPDKKRRRGMLPSAALWLV